ncbi:MAG: M14 metallopeptidase family protein [Kofleriaceae bacterium]
MAVAALAVAFAAAGVAYWQRQHASPPSPVTRVAIRVPCDDPARCAVAEALALDVWTEHRSPGEPFDIVVASDMLPVLDAHQIVWQMLVPDIDELARAEAERLRRPAALRPADWFAEYHDYNDISEHVRQLALLAPDRASLHAIGASVEGRPLWALRIGGQHADATPMLINGTQHAREWIAAMVTTCVADRLVRDYQNDSAIRDFVDSTELWVVPVANPDGYQYSWGNDRFWRKNRHGRHGVDLNRNFSVAWGGRGSSKNERAENYHGEYAFSEPETIALRDLAMHEQIALHVDFHAYGQLVMYPWGYTAKPADDRDRFAAVGDNIASAMFATHEKRYKLMQSVELYPAGGTMMDWMYGEARAQSFTIELRPGPWPDSGRYGFVLPPEQIRPTCDEGLAAVLALRRSH